MKIEEKIKMIDDKKKIKMGQLSKSDKKFLKNFELAGKLVLLEDAKLLEELGKEAKQIITINEDSPSQQNKNNKNLVATKSRSKQQKKTGSADKNKNKIHIYEPVSIEDAINCLQTFLESDLWSNFKDDKINGKVYFRKDKFKSEKELWDYLDGHFDILRKEVKNLLDKEIYK